MLAENNSAQPTNPPKEPITPELFDKSSEFLTKASKSIGDFSKSSFEKGMAAIAEARDTIANQVITVHRYTEDDKAHANKRIDRIPEAKRENALANINRMKELGLVASDSPEVSLYKMHSAYNLLSGSSDMLVQQDGKSVKKEARDVLGTTDKDGKKLSHKQVLNKLVSGHLSDEELKIYADSVNKVETSVSTQGRIVANMADNHNRLAKNNSYQMGGDSGVKKTLSLKLLENSQNKIGNEDAPRLAMNMPQARGHGIE